MGKTLKIYFQVIADVCVKRMLLEHLFWKETQRICSWNLSNISTVEANSWYIHKRCFCKIWSADFWKKIFQKIVAGYYQRHARGVFYKKRVFLKVFLKGLRACNFIKKRLQHRCFPVKFAKFLRIPILKNICKRLLRSHNSN